MVLQKTSTRIPKMFKDRPDETIGTRQHHWLTYLQYHNTNQNPIQVAKEYDRGKYSKWETNTSCVCPIDHRGILPYESVIEFDTDNREIALKLIDTLSRWAQKRGIEHYIQDHGGRSPHLHLFNEPITTNWKTQLLLKTGKIDVLKQTGKGLCREIGGTYNTKNKQKNYVSFFKTVEEIREIKKPGEVRFPCLNIT